MYKDDNHFVEISKVQAYVSSMTYDVYVDERIDNPEYYRSVITTFNKATENDTIEVWLNSEGGRDDATSGIVFAMDHCQANIVINLVGKVCSNGTIIALHGDEWKIAHDVVFMCHTGFGGFVGSLEKVKKHHDFIQNLNREIIFREYEGFLSSEECEEIVSHGEEYWFGAEELKKRLQNFQQYREDKNNSAMEEILQHQNSEMEKYENILLDKLVEEGSITEKDKQIALKVQKASEILDKTLSDEDVNNLMNDTFLDGSVEEELPSYMIFDTNDQEYAIVSYEILDGEPIRVELELLEEEGTITVDKSFLQDIPKEELKSILDNLGVKYAWNAGDVRLAEMVEQAITETAKEHLQENLK